MGTYNLPRNVKGEGRILFIFTTKSIIYTAISGGLGILISLAVSSMGIKYVGLIVIIVLALLGFAIGTFKVPNISGIKWARTNAGENLDDVIKRAIMFKRKGNQIYIYKKGETNDK